MIKRNTSGARRSERGASFVELGFALSALALIVVGTVDFARVFYFSMELTAAARAGAQYAAYSSANSSNPTGILNAAVSGAPNISVASGAPSALSTSDITLGDIATTGNSSTASTRVQIPKCAPSNGASPGLWANPTSAQPWDCSSTCGAGLTLVCYVKVTATKTFTPRSGFMGIPNSMSISRSAMHRRE